MTADDGRSGKRVVVVGLGNTYRGDDGVGIAVAAALNDRAMPNVVVRTGIADPMGLLEAWTGAGLAVIVDAAIVSPPTPGRIRRCDLSDVSTQPEALSSHSVDIGRTHALGLALGRVPDDLVVFTVDVADTAHRIGLTPPVARAVPELVRMVADEINHARPTAPRH